MPTDSDTSLLWDPNYPPSLKKVPFGVIADCTFISGPKEVNRALFAVNPWEKLQQFGGSLRSIAYINDAYLAIAAADGRVWANPDGVRIKGARGNVQFWEADVSEWSEWHLISPPNIEGADHTFEARETVTFETSSLQSYASEIAASVEATASYNGLVTSGSITAKLSTTFSSSVQKQQTYTTTKEIVTTNEYKAGHAYATWHKYKVFEFCYRNDIVDDRFAPFTADQMNAINPGRVRLAALSAVVVDSCPKEELFQPEPQPA